MPWKRKIDLFFSFACASGMSKVKTFRHYRRRGVVRIHSGIAPVFQNETLCFHKICSLCAHFLSPHWDHHSGKYGLKFICLRRCPTVCCPTSKCALLRKLVRLNALALTLDLPSLCPVRTEERKPRSRWTWGWRNVNVASCFSSLTHESAHKDTLLRSFLLGQSDKFSCWNKQRKSVRLEFQTDCLFHKRGARSTGKGENEDRHACWST